MTFLSSSTWPTPTTIFVFKVDSRRQDIYNSVAYVNHNSTIKQPETKTDPWVSDPYGE